MIDILMQYGKSFLWTDGYHFTGVAVTLWLLVISLAVGFMMALPMAIARVSNKKALWMPVWFFSYIFRGTPLYVQLLVFYSGVYTLSFVRETEFLNWFFRSGFNCTILALALNTCAYTMEIFAGAIRSIPHGEIEARNNFV